MSSPPNPQTVKQDNLGIILNSIGDAVLVTDAGGRITLLNPVAETLTGWTTAEAGGQDSRTVFDIISESTRQRVPSPVERVLRDGTVVGLANHTILRRRDGTEVPIDDSAAPVRDESGNLTGVVLVFRDITERRQAEVALRIAEDRLRLATGSANIGTWDLDPVTNTLFWDERCRAAFDYQRDLPIDYAACFTMIHPDDRVPTDTAVNAALAPGASGQYRVEFRTIGYGDGKTRWVRAEGKALFDAAHPEAGAIRLVGTIQDITAQREAQDALARSEARFRMQADTMPQMVWATDPQGQHLYYNQRWYEYTGQSVEESLGFGFALALHPDDYDRTIEQWRRSWEDGDNYDIEYRFRRRDGVYRWFVGRAEPVRDPETGAVLLWSGTCTDIDDLKQLQERQQFLAEFSQRISSLLEPEAVIGETVRSLGAFLGLSRLVFAEISESEGTVRAYPDWHGAGENSLPSVQGSWKFAEWGEFVAPWGETLDELRGGKTVFVRDFAGDPRTRDAYAAAAPDARRARAAIQLPLPRETVWVGLLSAQSATPRDWSPEEIALLEATGDRLWLTLENSRLFRETRMRADREALVNKVGVAIRSSPLDARTILQATVNTLGQGLQADRCYFARYDQANDRASVEAEWYRPDLAPMEGRVFQMSAYSVNRDPDYQAGQTHVVNDVVTFDPGSAAPLLEIGIRGLLRVPLRIGNNMTALAVAMSGEPRQWTRGEIRIVETVAFQLQSALDAARLLTDERQRAEREHLLNAIGEAVRSSSDPTEMQRILVERLGQALGADRCFVAIVDVTRDLFEIPRDFRADDTLPSLTGRYTLSDFTDNIDTIYPRGKTLVVADTSPVPGAEFSTGPSVLEPTTAAAAAAAARMGLCSVVSVPVREGERLAGMLCVGTAHVPRLWTPEELTLIESVATQARAAIESARLQQRERNIATHLQEALQPPKPPRVPGIALSSYYRPALSEASVGGDFFDVFSVGRDCTALVVADLSGKGLAAAQQVATVRNMLRYAVYCGSDLAESLTQLHRTLVNQELLTGFATLFIGRYDPDTRTLVYVNCGQEPGLVWRSETGEIEALSPTGPILGGFLEGQFEQRTLTLRSGDVLALFTDGLTEVGPSRKSLLEVEGVIQLLSACCTGTDTENENIDPAAGLRRRDPESLVSRLIASVDAYAGGGVQDDIALLMGVVD